MTGALGNPQFVIDHNEDVSSVPENTMLTWGIASYQLRLHHAIMPNHA